MLLLVMIGWAILGAVVGYYFRCGQEMIEQRKERKQYLERGPWEDWY